MEDARTVLHRSWPVTGICEASFAAIGPVSRVSNSLQMAGPDYLVRFVGIGDTELSRDSSLHPGAKAREPECTYAS